MNELANELRNEYDIIICGGGLAGLTLARQISREIPHASLLLVEGLGDKLTTKAIQVGESTIELSANYLAQTLGLQDYLDKVHFCKWGLRFFFGSGDTPFQDRPEVGTSFASPIKSYQLDRALLETDLKRLNKRLGIQMLKDSKVEDINLSDGDEAHEVVVFDKAEGRRRCIKSHWVIDAMGRRRFLQKKMGIAKPQNPHYSASWFRLKGRIDVCDLVPRSITEWHDRVPDDNRYYSTNHLMDNGRWVWLIPLASGNTSIGIVTHESFFPFTEYNTFELAQEWLHRHEPLLWNMIRCSEPLDFQCLRHYSYSAKQICSQQRWACTGDAAIFADPFFSPGIDQIGFANTIITNIIKREREGRLDPLTVERLNEAFLSFHEGVVWLTQPAYAFYGDALVMAAKLVWDFARGFSINASQRFNHIYLEEEKGAALHPTLSRLFTLTLRVEKLFRVWAARRAVYGGRGYSFTFVDYLSFPGMLELYHRNFRCHKTREELVSDHRHTLDYLEELAQIIFLIALADTMPEMLSQLPSPLWLNAWGIGLDTMRWEADRLFAPTSKPRPIQFEQYAAIFGVTDLCDLLKRR